MNKGTTVWREKQVKLDRDWRIVFDHPKDLTNIWSLSASIIDVAEDRLVFIGTIRRTGCADWDQRDSFHVCGSKDGQIFGLAHEEAMKLMG